MKVAGAAYLIWLAEHSKAEVVRIAQGERLLAGSINSVAEILRSRVVVEQAVDAVTPAAILFGEKSSGPLSARERAIPAPGPWC